MCPTIAVDTEELIIPEAQANLFVRVRDMNQHHLPDCHAVLTAPAAALSIRSHVR